MVKCTKCGAIFGKEPNSCFYCNAVSFEEVDTEAYKEEQSKKIVKNLKLNKVESTLATAEDKKKAEKKKKKK